MANSSEENNGIQALINSLMREKIDINAFKKETIKTKIANTHGIFCPVCGSNNVHCEVIQLRSSDEASDKIFTCLRCGYMCKNKFLHDNGAPEFKAKIKELNDKYNVKT